MYKYTTFVNQKVGDILDLTGSFTIFLDNILTHYVMYPFSISIKPIK